MIVWLRGTRRSYSVRATKLSIDTIHGSMCHTEETFWIHVTYYNNDQVAQRENDLIIGVSRFRDRTTQDTRVTVLS